MNFICADWFKCTALTSHWALLLYTGAPLSDDKESRWIFIDFGYSRHQLVLDDYVSNGHKTLRRRSEGSHEPELINIINQRIF